MPKPNLRVLIARLAVDRADLRPALVRLLRATGNTSVVQQPPIVISQPPIIVQQEMPAATAAPVPEAPPTAVVPQIPSVPQPPQSATEPESSSPPAALFVTERTQKGFEADLLPEMERLLSEGMAREAVATYIRGLIAQAFTSKNHLYNILIRHQATFEGDAEYKESLERLVQAWVTDTADAGV